MSESAPHRSAGRLTVANLQQQLRDVGALTEADLRTALGSERHRANLTLNRCEVLLIRAGVVAEEQVAAAKRDLSGRPVPSDADLRVRPDLIDADAARVTGLLAVDAARPTVALVEDSEDNLRHARTLVGHDDFDVVLLVATQFSRLHRAAYQGEHAAAEPPQDVYALLDEAERRDASDVHLAVGFPPMLRVRGELLSLPYRNLDRGWMDRAVADLLPSGKQQRFADHADADAAIAYGDTRFRINAGRDARGVTLVARRLPTRIPTMDGIGLPYPVRELCELQRGLVLVTGPTGSGKSTTLAAMLSHIAASSARHIVTLEDPIEFTLPAGRAMVNQREVGESLEGFAEGLRQALRQDPDVVLVGEMRDLETIRTAITAAETGHLVFGTLHTYDAPSTVARLINSFPSGEQQQIRSQVAYILSGVVSQTLLPTADGRGRAAAFEVMLSNPAVQTNLRKPDGHLGLRHVIEQGRRDGMQTIDMALAQLVADGTVDQTEAELRARDRDEFRAFLGR